MTIVATKFVRKPLYVDAVLVTPENLHEVADWCQGNIITQREEDGRVDHTYIQVRVTSPMTLRHSQAWPGDWILWTPRGYKVYTPKAFESSFDRVPTNQLELVPNFDASQQV